MGVLLSFIPEKDLFYGALFAILLAGGAWAVHHERVLGAAHEMAVLKDSSDKLQAAAIKQNQETASNYAATVAAVTEKADENQKSNAAQHDADLQRLRELDAYRSEHPPLEGTGSGTGNPAAGAQGDLGVERRLSSLEQVAAGLAAAVRDDRDTLTGCMADRDALTGK